MLINNATLEALNQGIEKAFDDSLAKTETPSDEITFTVPVSQSIVNFPFLDVCGAMREWVDKKRISNIALQKVAVTIKDWEYTLGISRNSILDDELGLYGNIAGRLARTAKLHKQDRVVYALQNGTSATLMPNFDALATFSTSHTLNAAGVQSNNITTNALSATNYQTARATMKSLVGSDGRSLNVNPTHLVVPPQLEAVARGIVEMQFISGGGNNVNYNTTKVIVLNDLSNEATTWYLLDASLNPIVYAERQTPTMVSLTDPTDENVFHRKEFLYSLEARGEAFLGPWFAIQRSIA